MAFEDALRWHVLLRRRATGCEFQEEMTKQVSLIGKFASKKMWVAVFAPLIFSLLCPERHVSGRAYKKTLTCSEFYRARQINLLIQYQT